MELAGDHPGFTDLGYRARRDHLAGLATAWVPGQPLPAPEYNEEEHEAWRVVSASLAGLHEQMACRAFLAGKEALQLPVEPGAAADRREWAIGAVAGSVTSRSRGWRRCGTSISRSPAGFWSTQYLRHRWCPVHLEPGRHS